MISIEEALQLIESTVSPFNSTIIELDQAVGHLLSRSVLADVDSPPHNKSVMDGFAVRAEDVRPGARFEVLETIIAGSTPTRSLSAGTASQIMTGAPLPERADAVVMIEKSKPTQTDGKRTVTFDIDMIEAGKHIMSKAASFAAGEEIFPVGHKIRPLDIGLLAEVGASQVEVYPQPTAAVIPTGNELVAASQKPGPGQIRNSNGPMLIELFRSFGVKVDDPGVARDDEADLRSKVRRGLQSDLLVLSGGVSAGTMDLVPKILGECGVQEIFHKVKVKPGKPIWFGVRQADDQTTYVFGLPGNPVSSLVGFQLFVRAALARMSGCRELQPTVFPAKLCLPHHARGDRPTWWPGKRIQSDNVEQWVEPLQWQGSSDLRALGHADCLIFFPTGIGEFKKGTTVSISLLPD